MPKEKKTAKPTAKPAKKNEDSAVVKAGDKLRVEYTGSFDDGTVFDSSDNHGKPLEFVSGSRQLIKGFDDAVIGMKKGEEKTIRLVPAEAYGDRSPDLIKQVPKERLPAEPQPQKGMMLILTSPQGVQLPALITEVGEKEVSIDLNHPLAGKTLNFKIKVVEINPEGCSDEKCDSCGCGCH